jgi:type I restriction enzyme S subunit
VTTVPLGELIEPAALKRAGTGEYTLLSMTMHDGLVEQAARFAKRIAGRDLTQYKVVERGQLVVSFPIDEGVLDFLSTNESGIVSPAYRVWDLSGEDSVHRPYLKRYLRSPRALNYYRIKMRGSTARRRSMPVDDFLAMPIPLPSVDEQRRIAAILDQADAIRTKRRQVIAHLDSLTQSIFHEMFDSYEATSTVSEVAIRMRTGPFGSQLLHDEFVDEGIAVLGLDNVVANHFKWVGRRFITEQKYEKLQRYTVSPGDVLISIMGTTGRCVVVPNDIPTAINTKHICAVTVDRENVDPEFLRGVFLWHPASRAHLRRQTKGSIMAGLNMGIIKAMPIPVPPIRLQKAFTRRVDEVHAALALATKACDSADALFNSLQSRAFKGEP